MSTENELLDEEMGNPELNIPVTFKVNDDKDFPYLPREETTNIYSSLTSVKKEADGMYSLNITYEKEEDKFIKTFHVQNGDILEFNVVLFGASWMLGVGVFECKVKVSELSEDFVTLTMIEKGDKNLAF